MIYIYIVKAFRMTAAVAAAEAAEAIAMEVVEPANKKLLHYTHSTYIYTQFIEVKCMCVGG
jgi:hypothetical protein